ncbi:hypothetical protein DEO72_LG10g505 [Vigna unguiculata]|uniref:Uncharacterized protein n=1 Tax=Vigna unguiculata TaxID=3917 RepID=A0A4D6N6C0_VIGUN|nr:hypothetical protein DEO72_LG10g505 [Vigna unguiculata]
MTKNSFPAISLLSSARSLARARSLFVSEQEKPPLFLQFAALALELKYSLILRLFAFWLLNAFGMMNEVFGGMRLVLFASGMFLCVCVPAACVKQWPKTSHSEESNTLPAPSQSHFTLFQKNSFPAISLLSSARSLARARSLFVSEQEKPPLFLQFAALALELKYSLILRLFAFWLASKQGKGS